MIAKRLVSLILICKMMSAELVRANGMQLDPADANDWEFSTLRRRYPSSIDKTASS